MGDVRKKIFEKLKSQKFHCAKCERTLSLKEILEEQYPNTQSPKCEEILVRLTGYLPTIEAVACQNCGGVWQPLKSFILMDEIHCKECENEILDGSDFSSAIHSGLCYRCQSRQEMWGALEALEL